MTELTLFLSEKIRMNAERSIEGSMPEHAHTIPTEKLAWRRAFHFNAKGIRRNYCLLMWAERSFRANSDKHPHLQAGCARAREHTLTHLAIVGGTVELKAYPLHSMLLFPIRCRHGRCLFGVQSPLSENMKRHTPNDAI